MADDYHPESHPAPSTGRLPVPGADRQRAYRRGRDTKSLDVSGQTHELLRALCDRDGLGIDAAVRSAVETALGQSQADREVVEAAWVYLEATQASSSQLRREGILTERQMRSVQDASTEFNAIAKRSGELSPKAHGRAQWLTEQGMARVRYVDSNSVPADPLAADARHGTVGDTAQTLTAGGSGIGLHNASLLLMAAADDDPGGVIVRVRVPGPSLG